MSKSMSERTTDHVMRITHLRKSLGWAYQCVANTDEPIVIQRYSKQDVVMVPLWEWQFLKQMEAAIRAGEPPWLDAQMADLSPTVGPCGEVSANLAMDGNAWLDDAENAR